MAVAWTDITNGQVAAGAALTTALVTALRDNPEGIAQRASGAPKIFGNAYDYQEFTSSGTWTKPSNAESGDKVIVHVVAGGGAGQRLTSASDGGMGGAGAYHKFEDIDDLGATETVTVGAGGTATSGSGGNGGNSSFGTSTTSGVTSPGVFLQAIGGAGGDGISAQDYDNHGFVRHTRNDLTASQNEARLSATIPLTSPFGWGGEGGDSGPGGGSATGGGGGGMGSGTNGYAGGLSLMAGRGGNGSGVTGTITNFAINGEFPGGGGGGVDDGTTGDTVGGAGAAGVVRVWCLREEA